MEFYIQKTQAAKAKPIVSIPNGMEFYPTLDRLTVIRCGFQFPTGWNSTTSVSLPHHRHKSVSIPNGMEFYKRSLLWDLQVNCFNSQRDGILLTPFCFELVLHTVSIPNGMEFYRAYSSSVKITARFQFPTGWNSTNNQRQLHLILYGFNSQRDGILRRRKRIGWYFSKEVSIPNGMEFYHTLKF